MIYDSTVYTAKVTVTCDTSTDTLRSEVVYEKNGTPITGDVPVFANVTETLTVSVQFFQERSSWSLLMRGR